MRTIKAPILALLAICALALSAAACGGNDAKPVANVKKLTGKTTSVKLDKGFVKALTKLKVTPGPVGKAKITKSGKAVFPITGGNVKYFKPGSTTPYVQGEIMHKGSGLSLKAGGTKVELTDFVVDPGKSVLTGKVSANGKVAAESAPLFSLDGRTLKPLKVRKKKNVAILKGATVKLRKEAADLLNKTFKIDALKEGLVIGVATIKINAS